MIKIHKVIRDISNYFALRRIIKRESKSSPVWAKHGLRVDWIGRIYTVYNIPPEVTKSPDVPREAWIAYIIDRAKSLNEYLTSLNLQEIVIPEYKEIPGTDSYLLMYKPYFQEFGWKWIITRTIFWISIIILQVKFGIFNWLF